MPIGNSSAAKKLLQSLNSSIERSKCGGRTPPTLVDRKLVVATMNAAAKLRIPGYQNAPAILGR